MGDDNEFALLELVQFLEPTTRLDVRKQALEIVIGSSAALDRSAGKAFAANDYAIAKAICKLCELTNSDRMECFVALTNFSSCSSDAADYVLEKSCCPRLAWETVIRDGPHKNFAAQLLANLSRHFPDKLLHQLIALDEKLIDTLIGIATAEGPITTSRHIGYVLVNLSTLPKIRKELLLNERLSRLYPVFRRSEVTKREMVADILRNLCFEDGLHEQLVDANDELLVALMTPLADSDDDLDDEEMAKLPLRLQYFEGKREEDVNVRQKLIEALYQLCATKIGRECLRKKGIYALLRELDRATSIPEDPNAPPPKMRPPQLLAQEEHTLHALIGVLIRYEDEMGVDPAVPSLKHLE